MATRDWLVKLGLVVFALLFATGMDVTTTGCPHMKVRPDSPCVTVANACFPNAGVCPGNGQDVKKGDFQCDISAQNKYCTGNNHWAICYWQAKCRVVPGSDPVSCEVSPQDPNGQFVAAESKVTATCDNF